MKNKIIIFLALTIFVLVFIEACGNPFFPGLMDNLSRKGSGTGGGGGAKAFGTVAWVNTLTGVGKIGSWDPSARFSRIAIDQNGNVYTLGTQNSDFAYSYGNEAATTVAGTASVTNDILVKYGADGKAKWAKTVGRDPAGLAKIEAITVDAAGNIYITGEITGPNPALVKYDTNGNLLWKSTVPEDLGLVVFKSVAVDKAGNAYAAGKNTGNNSVLVKYDSSGKDKWVKTVTEGTDPKRDPIVLNPLKSNAVAVDQAGNVYVTAKDTDNNSVLVKYNSTGSEVWTKAVTGKANYVQLAVDGVGSIYVTGYQDGTDTYDYGNKVTVAGTSAGKNPILVKYDSDGNAKWAKTPEGSGLSGATFYTVAVDKAGYVYVAGDQLGTLNYGNEVTVIGPDFFEGERSSSVLVKYNTNGITLDAWIVGKVSSGESNFWDIALDPSSNYLYTVGYQDTKDEFDYGNDNVVKGKCGENPILVKFYR